MKTCFDIGNSGRCGTNSQVFWLGENRRLYVSTGGKPVPISEFWNDEHDEPATKILDERICHNLLIVDESFVNVSRAHVTIK